MRTIRHRPAGPQADTIGEAADDPAIIRNRSQGAGDVEAVGRRGDGAGGTIGDDAARREGDSDKTFYRSMVGDSACTPVDGEPENVGRDQTALAVADRTARREEDSGGTTIDCSLVGDGADSDSEAT